MDIYINALESISPQPTFDTEDFLSNVIAPEGDYFTCHKPEYKDYISPKLMRRMSTIIRNGVAASMVSLKKAQVENPGAIILGTGLGCLTDTVKFLTQMIENDESLLNPTAFIQSTHNTVSGQIALLLGCKNNNLTYTQNSLSFETALIDGILLLKDNEAENVLVGGLDEITTESHQLLTQTCCMQNVVGKGAKVFGEGASFFVLSNTKSDKNIARIVAVTTGNRSITKKSIVDLAQAFLSENGVDLSAIDVLVSGKNGNSQTDELYDSVLEILPNATLAEYKHLVGEYDTVSGFALWLGAKIIEKQMLPQAIQIGTAKHKQLTHMLVVNVSKAKHYSFMLIATC